jgi:hypothetical protein
MRKEYRKMIEITRRILRTRPPHPQRVTCPRRAHTPHNNRTLSLHPRSAFPIFPGSPLLSHRRQIPRTAATSPDFPSTAAISSNPTHRRHLAGFPRPPPTPSLLAASQPPTRVLHPRPHQQPRLTARGGRRRHGSAGEVEWWCWRCCCEGVGGVDERSTAGGC